MKNGNNNGNLGNPSVNQTEFRIFTIEGNILLPAIKYDSVPILYTFRDISRQRALRSGWARSGQAGSSF